MGNAVRMERRSQNNVAPQSTYPNPSTTGNRIDNIITNNSRISSFAEPAVESQKYIPPPTVPRLIVSERYSQVNQDEGHKSVYVPQALSARTDYRQSEYQPSAQTSRFENQSSIYRTFQPQTQANASSLAHSKFERADSSGQQNPPYKIYIPNATNTYRAETIVPPLQLAQNQPETTKPSYQGSDFLNSGKNSYSTATQPNEIQPQKSYLSSTHLGSFRQSEKNSMETEHPSATTHVPSPPTRLERKSQTPTEAAFLVGRSQ